MPWSRGSEVYLSGPNAIPGVALDYDVVPLAVVDRVRVELHFDSVQREPFVLDEDCPSTLSASAWGAPSIVDEVVWARIDVGAAHQASRFAWISYPIGGHTLSLDVSAVPTSERTGTFFVVFVPSDGRPRITVRSVELTAASGNALSVGGLPNAAGHVAVIRTTHVTRLDGGPALRAFGGFSTLWAAASELWYGALVPADQVTPVVLERLRGSDESARRSGLHADDAPSSEATPIPFESDVRLLAFGPGISGADALIECDGVTSIQTPFDAELHVSLDGSDAVILPGDNYPLDPECTGASETSLIHVRVESNTHSGFVVLRGA